VTTSTPCGSAGDDGEPALRRVSLKIDPETRLGRHADYFGTEVIEFGISRPHSALTIDVRARVVTSEPPEPPDPDWDSI
jgi:hypothetical protein